MSKKLKSLSLVALLAAMFMFQTPTPANAGWGWLCWWCGPPSAEEMVQERPNLNSQPIETRNRFIITIEGFRGKGISESEIQEYLDKLDNTYLELGSNDIDTRLYFRGPPTDPGTEMIKKYCKKLKLKPKTSCAIAITTSTITATMLREFFEFGEDLTGRCKTDVVGKNEPEEIADAKAAKAEVLKNNRLAGKLREHVMLMLLRSKYECQNIFRERYLRDTEGKIFRDVEAKKKVDRTGRRLDFVVVDDHWSGGNVIDVIEVTGLNVNKDNQTRRERRFKELGATWVRKPGNSRIWFKTKFDAAKYLPARISEIEIPSEILNILK